MYKGDVKFPFLCKCVQGNKTSPLNNIVLVSLATITKCHGLGDLNNRRFSSYSCADWKSEIRMLAWWRSGEVPLLGLQMASSACVLRERERKCVYECVSLPLIIKPQFHWIRPHLTTSVNLNYLLKTLSTDKSTLEIKASRYEFGRKQLSP